MEEGREIGQARKVGKGGERERRGRRWEGKKRERERGRGRATLNNIVLNKIF